MNKICRKCRKEREINAHLCQGLECKKNAVFGSLFCYTHRAHEKVARKKAEKEAKYAFLRAASREKQCAWTGCERAIKPYGARGLCSKHKHFKTT